MTVSVFICTYNRGNLIDGTLRAIIEGQTRKPNEIVVVNGGGTNDCHAAIVKWQKLFPKLREIKTKNVNLATSRNIGLPQCKGDIILQTDDDAEPFPNWIERLVDEHRKHPEAGVIGGNVVDASGKGLIFKIADATTFTHFNEEGYCETRTVPGVNSSYKRDTIEKVGTYDTNMFRGEDVDYNWRCIKAGYKVLSFPDIKVYHHHRATWRGLYNQQYMYGRAYLLVRRKWKDMYCCYPHGIYNLRDLAKFCYFCIVPFVDQAHKLKHVKGFFNKLIAYPIMVTIGYNWHRGVFVQYFKELKKMKPKPIYVFANSYKPVLGGVQTVASQFAEGCKSRGIRTIVITNLYPRQLKIYEKISSTPVIRLPFAIPDGNLKNVFMFGISLCVSFLLFLCCRPNCVYVHFPLSQSSCLSVLHRIFNFKIITCFHGHDVLRYEDGYPKESVQYRAQRRLVGQSDQVTACSGYLARCVERTFGCTNVCVVYNGVDLARFDNFKPSPVTLENTPYLFAWGRLEQIKGFDLLIQAFARSKNSHELKLLIAGEGSERENLQQLIDSLELKDRAMLIGRLTPDEVVQYAQNSKINIIPSIREPFGIVALEAIAAKCPVIATNGGGLPEIMPGKYGLKVPADADEIGIAIDKVLTEEISFDYSDTREYLKHFTIKRMVENYLILQSNHDRC